MATLKTIEKNFLNLDPEIKAAQLSAVGYIKFLASTMNVNIERWDLLKIFADGDTKNIVTDRKVLNKIFTNKVLALAEKKAEAETSTPNVQVIPKLEKTLETGFRTIWNNSRLDLQKIIQENMDRVEQVSRDISTYMNRAAVARRKLDQMVDNLEPVKVIVKDIQNTIESGRWINPVVDGNYLWLNTATNIYLQHKNPAAGINIELDVGQFTVRIDLNTFNMHVFPYKNNIVWTGSARHSYYHPHVSATGNICWGNASDTVASLRKTFAIGGMIDLLYHLLSSYSDEAPYVHLLGLRDAHKKLSRIPTNMKHPDKFKKSEENDEPLKSNQQWDVNDLVEFEMAQVSDGWPRWNMNRDQGASGVWHSGFVVSVTPTRGIMLVQDDDNGVQFEWPINDNDSAFRDAQWSNPGYIRHI